MNALKIFFVCATIGLLMMVAGCSRKITSSTTSEVFDSVRIVEVPREVPVYLPGDTVTLDHYIECDSITNKPKPFKASAKGSRTTLKVEVNRDGKLSGRCESDSLKEIIKTMDKEIFRLRTQNKSSDKTTPVFVKSKFDKFTNWWFAITALALIGFVFYKLKNFF